MRRDWSSEQRIGDRGRERERQTVILEFMRGIATNNQHWANLADHSSTGTYCCELTGCRVHCVCCCCCCCLWWCKFLMFLCHALAQIMIRGGLYWNKVHTSPSWRVMHGIRAYFDTIVLTNEVHSRKGPLLGGLSRNRALPNTVVSMRKRRAGRRMIDIG